MAALERVIAEIRTSDPMFFAQFEQKITSGNEITIEDGLQSAARTTLLAALTIDPDGAARRKLNEDGFLRTQVEKALLLRGRPLDSQTLAAAAEALRKLLNPDVDAKNSALVADPRSTSQIVAVEAVVVYVAAAVDVVAAVNYVAAVDLAFAISVAVYYQLYFPQGPVPGATALSHEMLIESIATRLGRKASPY
jgi:hypothetical protein